MGCFSSCFDFSHDLAIVEYSIIKSYIMKHKVAIACFAIITNEHNEILLAHRTDRDMWNLPWGGLDAGESPEDCILREINEETWLTATINRLIGIYTKTKKDEVVFLFQCIAVSGELTLNDEADQLHYFAHDHIPDNTIPKQVERIDDYYQLTDEKLIMKYQ